MNVEKLRLSDLQPGDKFEFERDRLLGKATRVCVVTNSEKCKDGVTVSYKSPDQVSEISSYLRKGSESPVVHLVGRKSLSASNYDESFSR